MQRSVLHAIETYRTPGAWWRGGEVVPSGTTYCVSGGREFELPEDLIDMRGVSAYLSRELDKRGRAGEVSPSFSASFSRAVRSLAQRGELEPVTALYDGRFYRLSDKQSRLTHTEPVG